MTTLWLNNHKVYQHFGQHPERGRRIKGLGVRKTYCGIKHQAKRWFNPKTKEGGVVKDKDGNLIWTVKPNPIEVCAVVALKKTKELGFWEVVCEPQYRTQIETWLIDKCR